MNRIPGDRNTFEAERLKSLQRPFRIPVRGTSMLPLLRNGDLVRIYPLDENSLRSLPLGTLILFISPKTKMPVIHRIVGKSRNVVFEKGDRSRLVRAVPYREVIGAATHVKRNGMVASLEIPFRWRLRNLLAKLGLL